MCKRPNYSPHYTPNARDPQYDGYWESAASWAKAYVETLPDWPTDADPDRPIDATEQALQIAFYWPLYQASWHRGWQDWNGRFDADLFGRIDGGQLLRDGLTPFAADYGPEDVVDALHGFIGFLGEHGPARPEAARRICLEIVEAKVDCLRQFGRDIAAMYMEDPVELGAAPFVGWLADCTTFDCERRSVGEALAMTALEQLGVTEFDEADWAKFDIAKCIEVTVESSWMAMAAPSDYEAAARALPHYLYTCGLLSPGQKKRMLEGVRRSKSLAPC